MDEVLDDYLKCSMNCIGNTDTIKEITGLNVEEVVNELHETGNKVLQSDSKVYVFSDGKKKEIVNDLVKKYPESLLHVNMIDIDSRNSRNEIEIDFKLKYMDNMVNYMNNDYDIDELNGIEFDEFCGELMEMRIPFRMDIMNRLCTGFNEYGNRWKNLCLMVNGNEYKTIVTYMKKVWKLSKLKYNEKANRIECMIDDKYEPIIQSFSNYLQDKSKGEELYSAIDRKQLNSFFDEYPLDMDNKDVQDFFYPIYSPFLKESIINEGYYDEYIKKWVGNYKWKLLYRASEHEYIAVIILPLVDSILRPTSPPKVGRASRSPAIGVGWPGECDNRRIINFSAYISSIPAIIVPTGILSSLG